VASVGFSSWRSRSGEWPDVEVSIRVFIGFTKQPIGAPMVANRSICERQSKVILRQQLIYRTACPIKVNNSLSMRSDINRINPNNLLIFRISPENAHLHKRIMRGLEGLTTELGRHQDDEFSIRCEVHDQ
jgi:hypothetical protein